MLFTLFFSFFKTKVHGHSAKQEGDYMYDKKKKPLFFSTFHCKFLDKKTPKKQQPVRPHFQNNAKDTAHEKRHRLVFCRGPRGSVALLNSVQLALSCTCTITVSHLYFSPKISPNLFEASLYLSLAEWEACLFSAHSAVYTSAEGHFFANACFSGRLFVKCIMTCAYPQAESLR